MFNAPTGTTTGPETMASANDMKAAKATYSSFISAVKWSTPAVVLLTFVVILLIS